MILIKVPWLPSANRKFITYAITISPFVFILPKYAKNKAILAHEQVHLDQIKKAGWFKWYWKYLFNLDFRNSQESAGYLVQRLIEGGKVNA
jgi:hypothetical protein